jgi:hypothetical protein
MSYLLRKQAIKVGSSLTHIFLDVLTNGKSISRVSQDCLEHMLDPRKVLPGHVRIQIVTKSLVEDDGRHADADNVI